MTGAELGKIRGVKGKINQRKWGEMRAGDVGGVVKNESRESSRSCGK